MFRYPWQNSEIIVKAFRLIVNIIKKKVEIWIFTIKISTFIFAKIKK